MHPHTSLAPSSIQPQRAPKQAMGNHQRAMVRNPGTPREMQLPSNSQTEPKPTQPPKNLPDDPTQIAILKSGSPETNQAHQKQIRLTRNKSGSPETKPREIIPWLSSL
jgi:hypothetical protein